MIKLILNMLPRPVLQKLSWLAKPVLGLFYAGRGVECPLCGARYRRFVPYGYVDVRHNALCPRCLSLERHRLLWLWLTREKKILRPETNSFQPEEDFIHRATDPLQFSEANFLHIAPEVCLSRKFEKILKPQNYITADLESPLAKVKMDVQEIPFADETFDVVFCNHVLEHVADDRRALRELLRVTKTGGWGLLLSPVDDSRGETFEDDSITDRDARTRIFGQYDHRRVYGRDYPARLREEGWHVLELDYFAALPPALQKLHALRPEKLYIVRK